MGSYYAASSDLFDNCPFPLHNISLAADITVERVPDNNVEKSETHYWYDRPRFLAYNLGKVATVVNSATNNIKGVTRPGKPQRTNKTSFQANCDVGWTDELKIFAATTRDNGPPLKSSDIYISTSVF